MKRLVTMIAGLLMLVAFASVASAALRFPQENVLGGSLQGYLNGVGDAFDASGNLTKDALKTVMQQFLDAFAAHVAKHQG